MVGTDDESAAEVYAEHPRAPAHRAPPRPTATSTARSRGRSSAQYPGTVVTPALYEAATDAGPWRERGIPVYGLRPYPASATDLERMHGIDERVSIPGLNQGTDMVERILRSVATG